MFQELPLVKDMRGVQDTFCIYPWKSLDLLHNGSVLVCSKYTHGHVADPPLSVHDHSLLDIWNSEQMRNLRRALAQGQRVAGCKECYVEEEAGLVSYRVALNNAWKAGWSNEEGHTVDSLLAESARRDYYVPTGPAWLTLQVGNLCNLKCRMCTGDSSTRIARDPVQNQWSGTGPEVRTDRPPWYKRLEFIREELLPQPEHVRYLDLVGGETLIIKEVRDILKRLIDADAAKNVFLQVTTNATTAKSPWLDLAQEFQTFNLLLSIDGYEKHYEYIRYPARWGKLVECLDSFKQYPNANLTANVTVQAYNVLNLVELLRFFDQRNEHFVLYRLHRLPFLSIATLPRSIRQLAAQRLRTYAADECRPEHLQGVLGIAEALDLVEGDIDPVALRLFMLFTNDLDASRGQSFRETCAELYQLIEEAGFVWTDETVHAGRRPLPVGEVR